MIRRRCRRSRWGIIGFIRDFKLMRILQSAGVLRFLMTGLFLGRGGTTVSNKVSVSILHLLIRSRLVQSFKSLQLIRVWY
jgi:hypothetical protein